MESILTFHTSRPLLQPLKPIESAINTPQTNHTSRKDHRRKTKERHPLFSCRQLEDGIGVPSILAVAVFDPKPVGEGEDAAEGEGGKEGYGPGRGEEEQIGDEEEGGDYVEPDVG